MTDGSSKWAALGLKWGSQFPISRFQSELGTWLDTRAKPWGVGCKVCNQNRLVSIFANYEVTKPSQMQKINFQKHQKTKAHLGAVRDYLHRTGGCSGQSGWSGHSPANPSSEGGCLGPPSTLAPSCQEFSDFIGKFGKSTTLTRKELKMAWCLAEGVKVLDQRAIQSASLIALMRDERHGRVAVRFRSV